MLFPALNPNEVVVAVATPQQYGAIGDGITDDSAAFQSAINAVYNAGGSGGGVVFVPVGNYAFSNNITIPTGVTVHGGRTGLDKNRRRLGGHDLQSLCRLRPDQWHAFYHDEWLQHLEGR